MAPRAARARRCRCWREAFTTGTSSCGRWPLKPATLLPPPPLLDFLTVEPLLSSQDPEETDAWAGFKKIGEKLLNFSGQSKPKVRLWGVWRVWGTHGCHCMVVGCTQCAALHQGRQHSCVCEGVPAGVHPKNKCLQHVLLLVCSHWVHPSLQPPAVPAVAAACF